MKKRLVLALGGNALIKKGQKGTIYEQFANAREWSTSLADILHDGWEVVLVHGNGPQVGSILLQNEAGRDLTPEMPLGICVAESQGYMVYMIQQCVSNTLQKQGINKEVVSFITQVVVEKNDPAMQNPTKPIRPHYSKQRSQELELDGYNIIKQEKGWRIVVPSPDPKRVVEGDIIRKLLDQGVLVIAAGGGGMPVIEKPGWGLDGVEAVVDKDLSAACIAEAVDASVLLILTNVEHIFLHYNKKQQQPLHQITAQELQQWYDQGEFPMGSMGPKVQAALRFLNKSGRKAIIAHIDHGWEALQGKAGTLVTKE